MKQSRLTSALETLISTAAGFILSMIANEIVLPLFGFPVTLEQNFGITVTFTVISVIRQYTIRRIFNAI